MTEANLEKAREYRRSHREAVKAAKKRWALSNPDKVRAMKARSYQRNKGTVQEWSKRYRASGRRAEVRQRHYSENKAKVISKMVEYTREREKSDLNFRIRRRLRGRVGKALARSGCSRSGKTVELLGCPVPYFRAWLELDFREGWSWDNYGEVWEIDHILPCAAFDLTDVEQQRACFHHTNMQALAKKENRRKSDSVPSLDVFI